LIVGIGAFYTTSTWGLQCFKQALMAFFSGALIPIELMPTGLEVASNLMPFKSMIYFPISIFLGNLPANELLKRLHVSSYMDSDTLYCIKNVI